MLTAKLTLERFDKDMKLLERRVQPSRSFCLAFISLLYVAHANIQPGAPQAITDITNTSQNIDTDSGVDFNYGKGNLKMGSGPGDMEQHVIAGSSEATAGPFNRQNRQGYQLGVVIGTGNNPVSPLDYALQTQIAHGRSAGEMEYGGSELVNIAFAGANGTFDMRRYFTNLSGGGITVEEVGIYAAGCKYIGGDWGYAYSFCAARDVTGGVAVADTELLRVIYTIQITV